MTRYSHTPCSHTPWVDTRCKSADVKGLVFSFKRLNPIPVAGEEDSWLGPVTRSSLGGLPLHTSAMFFTSPFVDRWLHYNNLTSLPAGVFDKNTALTWLYVAPRGKRRALSIAGKREAAGSKSRLLCT